MQFDFHELFPHKQLCASNWINHVVFFFFILSHEFLSLFSQLFICCPSITNAAEFLWDVKSVSFLLLWSGYYYYIYKQIAMCYLVTMVTVSSIIYISSFWTKFFLLKKKGSKYKRRNVLTARWCVICKIVGLFVIRPIT